MYLTFMTVKGSILVLRYGVLMEDKLRSDINDQLFPISLF